MPPESHKPAMKLSELHPRWITLNGWSHASPFYIGMTFQCPHCLDQRLGVLFDPPIDPDALVGQVFPFDIHVYARTTNQWPVWSRTGDSFDTLTLTPSIDTAWTGHWHGFIEHGEIR